jgi:hypothetical protein
MVSVSNDQQEGRASMFGNLRNRMQENLVILHGI